jgi:hypothetical protein
MGSLEARRVAEGFWQAVTSIYFLVAPHGGIRPAQRRRSRLALTLAEREVICRGVTAHQSARSMAKLLGRSPSTVREMSRNGCYDRYRATLADENARRELVVQKPVAARVEREHQWPGETVLSEGHQLVGALASLSEQSGSSAK